MRKKRRGELEEYTSRFPEGEEPSFYSGRGRRWKRPAKWVSIVLAALLLASVVPGYLWLKSRESGMRLPEMSGALDAARRGQPVNTIIIGTDRRGDDGEGEGRSDILMLVSVSGAGREAAVISIPRDARVSIPGRSGYHKINAAHAYGGPRLVVQTVRELTGLEIHHVVAIDFEGFERIVDAIGGVPMHLEVAIEDRFAGNVPAGDVLLDGQQALTLVRARHDARAVPAGDLDRIKNQRRFLQAMLSTVSRQRNPLRIKRLVEAVSVSIKTDLTFWQMFSLGRKLRSEGLLMATAPGAPALMGGAWYYLIDEQEFGRLLSSFRPGSAETSGAAHRSTVTVRVLNGSGVAGLAGSVSMELESRGYRTAESANARSAYPRTTLYYSGGDGSGAELVAADLEGAELPVIERSDGLTAEHGVDVLVVLGRDYRPR